MTDSWRLKFRFWGVRGSTPTPRLDCLGYGGNTCCAEIRVPDRMPFIIDAGSGIRDLGLSLMQEFASGRLDLNVFFTHFHWDHLQGFPFFAPVYAPGNSVTFHSSLTSGCLQGTLAAPMTAPYFPVRFDALFASKTYIELDKQPVRFDSLSVQPFPVNHPQGALGYRIESKGAVIVFVPDREPGHAVLDSVIRQFAEGADILVHDAQYTPETYPRYVGWGHSSWLEAAAVAKDAKVKQLVLFHHDPSHNDDKISAMIDDTRVQFENTIGAREGLVLTL